MTFRTSASSTALLLVGITLAGCAGEGNDGLFTTGALNLAQASTPKADPACVTLAASIDGLRKEGIAEKIEKAAAKKYTMTAKDLRKADQLTKANADFQQRCSTLPPKPANAQAPAAPASAKTAQN